MLLCALAWVFGTDKHGHQKAAKEPLSAACTQMFYSVVQDIDTEVNNTRRQSRHSEAHMSIRQMQGTNRRTDNAQTNPFALQNFLQGSVPQ